MDVALLLEAAAFAAEKHKDQRRKGEDASPYINHPIEVARLLATIGGVTDAELEQHYDTILARGRQKLDSTPVRPKRGLPETLSDLAPIDEMLADPDARLLPPRDILL